MHTAAELLTLVTVVHEGALPLLELQARSLARHLDPDAVLDVVVVDNGTPRLGARAAEELRALYGPVAPRVRVLRARDVARVPLTTGWRSQQVLKLEVARQVRTSQYVVLDAKNVFVAPVDPAFFRAPDGRPRSMRTVYAQHRLRPDLERTLRYLGVDPATATSAAGFTATTTPFVLDTATATALLDDVERRSGRPFAREFVARGVLEFFLYTGWVLSTGRSLDEAFDVSMPTCPVLWPKAADAAGAREAVERSRTSGTPLFTVHQGALERLDAPARAVVAAYWAERGVFPDQAAASAALDHVQARIARASRPRRLAEVPLRGLARARRLADRGHPLPGRPAA
ncbi:DUF6492 family protein [Quadrisphaera setariae]|uniref:Glycosyl transferase family 2 n=1 Tax=Quadrisphaera setariae TaxID=2593304 RepID=A0A5C8ZH20_9ACTN|nr:DUF6492 family protein [Quadrisphaera setariae]TXR56383.1 hypothetical protein FMM08_09790 [Quadrisphaera setariae]